MIEELFELILIKRKEILLMEKELHILLTSYNNLKDYENEAENYKINKKI